MGRAVEGHCLGLLSRELPMCGHKRVPAALAAQDCPARAHIASPPALLGLWCRHARQLEKLRGVSLQASVHGGSQWGGGGGGGGRRTCVSFDLPRPPHLAKEGLHRAITMPEDGSGGGEGAPLSSQCGSHNVDLRASLQRCSVMLGSQLEGRRHASPWSVDLIASGTAPAGFGEPLSVQHSEEEGCQDA